jgi:hypothetical protein
MRRGLSIFLVLVLGLGPLTGVLPASDDLRLPACCRRNGAHHCAMAAMMEHMLAHMPPVKGPAFSVPLTCPEYPGPAAVLTPPAQVLAPAAAVSLPALQACIHAPAARRAVALSSPIRPRSGRGPPAA